MKRKIFIIGANSAFAKAAFDYLIKDNTVITATRSDYDITKVVTVPENTEVVINFAAAFDDESDEEVLTAEKTNALGMLNICIASRKARVKHIINISSLSAVHDEISPYYSVYAITKRHGDELASFYCKQHEIALTILRPSQIYGENFEFSKHQPFFYDVAGKAAKGDDITIYGKHDAQRNYIDVADLTEIINRVIAKRITGVYPCMYPSDVTFSQIAQIAQKVFSRGGNVRFAKDKPDSPDNIFKKDMSIYEKTDYYPQTSIEAGFRKIKNFVEKSAR